MERLFKRTNYLSLVPKSYEGNLRFRKEMILAGQASPQYARELRMMCALDILFYANTFCFLFEPRDTEYPVLPWITYPFQDETIKKLKWSVENGQDFVMLKTRAQGGTWMMCLYADWGNRFRRYQSGLLVSRVKDMVDSPNDPDSMFTKIDYIDKRLPSFLKFFMDRTFAHRYNPALDSVLDGISSNPYGASGRRRLYFLFDEPEKMDDFATMWDDSTTVTNCRIACSTALTYKSKFHVLCDDIGNGTNGTRLHWSQNPSQNADLTYDERGKPTSSWYRWQCGRIKNQAKVDRELDMKFSSDAGRFIGEDMIDRLLKSTARAPTRRLSWNAETRQFVEDDTGLLLLWEPERGAWTSQKTGRLEIPFSRYASGWDVAMGRGYSNSCGSFVDCKTGIKVAEYASAWIMPMDFAKLAVALMTLFHNAYAIWEKQGPGGHFGELVIREGYRNVYWQRNEEALIRKRATDIPGWHNNDNNKRLAFENYRDYLADGKFINHSEHALLEIREYHYNDKNVPEHSGIAQVDLVTDAKQSHGDRVIADMLACKGMIDRPYIPMEKPKEKKYPIDSPYARIQKHLAMDRQADLY